VLDRGIRFSMDGKGSWRDNVFFAWLWRSVKYEEDYLKAHDSVSHARRSIADYLTGYDQRQPYSRLADQTPYKASPLKNPDSFPTSAT
jgi:putative transposase